MLKPNPNAARPTADEVLAALDRLGGDEQTLLISRQKELVAHLFERGSTYTTVVIVAGYAGLFGIWNTLNTQLSQTLNILVGISLGLSLAAFVYYEVWKMFYYSIQTQQYGSAFLLPPKEAVRQIAKLEIAARDKLPRLYTTWLIIFIFTVATSVVAVSILLTALLLRLMGFV